MPESRFDNSGRVANLLNLSTSLRATPIYLGRSPKYDPNNPVDSGEFRRGAIDHTGLFHSQQLHQKVQRGFRWNIRRCSAVAVSEV